MIQEVGYETTWPDELVSIPGDIFGGIAREQPTSPRDDGDDYGTLGQLDGANDLVSSNKHTSTTDTRNDDQDMDEDQDEGQDQRDCEDQGEDHDTDSSDQWDRENISDEEDIDEGTTVDIIEVLEVQKAKEYSLIWLLSSVD